MPAFQTLQRPGRKPTKRGRPPTEGKAILRNHVRRLMPQLDSPTELYNLDKLPVPLSAITCSICSNIFHQPVQLGCKGIICSTCALSWIENSPKESVACPCCYEETLQVSSITSAPDAILELLRHLPLCNQEKVTYKHIYSTFIVGTH